MDLARPVLRATAGRRRIFTLDDVMACSPESHWFGCRKIKDVVVFKKHLCLLVFFILK